MRIIAIDCGASFIKGALLAEDGAHILRMEQRSTPVSHQRPVTQLEKTLGAVKDIMEKLSDGGGKEFALAVSNEMHGFVLADREGCPYMDYVSWQDESALLPYGDGNYLGYISRALSGQDILDTGMPVKAGLPSVNLFYYLNTKLAGVPAGAMYFYTLGDYILYKLSGQPPFTHPTNAAASGLYSITGKRWNTGMTDALGFAGIHFPEISENRTVEFAWEGRRFTAYPAIGDQQAALLGAGLLQPGELSVNMGTGAQVSVLCNGPQLSPDYQTRPYFFGKYLKTVPHIPSGRALNVYFGLAREIAGAFGAGVADDLIWQAIMEKAERCALEPMEMDLSFFSNTLTGHQSGSISGIKESGFTLGNIFRSAFIKMADNVSTAAQRIIGAEPVEKILFSGGVVQKNRLLQTLVLECFSVPLHSVGTNDTFLGLAAYVQSGGAITDTNAKA